MIKKLFTLTAMLLLVGLALVPATANASDCFCMDAGWVYKICYEDMSESYDITGWLFDPTIDPDAPIAGSAFVQSNGDILIGFSHLPLWNVSSTWVHPTATVNINFTQRTYTTTYHGNSEEPTLNYEGPASIVTCPSADKLESFSGPKEGKK